MPSFHLELPRPIPARQVDDLRRDLAPYGDAQEAPATTFNFETVALVISLTANVLQGIDVLVNWLKAQPRGNQAVIRLADGRTIRIEASGMDAFRSMLQNAVKEV